MGIFIPVDGSELKLHLKPVWPRVKAALGRAYSPRTVGCQDQKKQAIVSDFPSPSPKVGFLSLGYTSSATFYEDLRWRLDGSTVLGAQCAGRLRISETPLGKRKKIVFTKSPLRKAPYMIGRKTLISYLGHTGWASRWLTMGSAQAAKSPQAVVKLREVSKPEATRAAHRSGGEEGTGQEGRGAPSPPSCSVWLVESEDTHGKATSEKSTRWLISQSAVCPTWS